MLKVLCPGEALIDLFGTERKSLVDTVNFEKKAGGAPANAAGAMVSFGVDAYFAGTVGNDPFGHFLIAELDKYQINTKYMQQSNDEFTTFAYVSIDASGERDFIFNRGADAKFDLTTVELNQFDGFHFASATAFLGDELNEAYDQILDYAVENHKFISFDANYRDALFEDKQEIFIEKCLNYISKATIIKLSLEELQLITKMTDIVSAGQFLSTQTTGYLVITLGSKGTILFYDGGHYQIETIKVDNVVDTTGAGDAFIGALVAQAINSGTINIESMKSMISLANKVGAMTTTKIGALSSIPKMEDIEQL